MDFFPQRDVLRFIPNQSDLTEKLCLTLTKAHKDFLPYRSVTSIRSVKALLAAHVCAHSIRLRINKTVDCGKKPLRVRLPCLRRSSYPLL